MNVCPTDASPVSPLSPFYPDDDTGIVIDVR
nr:MAG TPA: hypothetical protein [Caudoviricetes sp.]